MALAHVPCLHFRSLVESPNVRYGNTTGDRGEIGRIANTGTGNVYATASFVLRFMVAAYTKSRCALDGNLPLFFKGIAAATGMRHFGPSSMALELEVSVSVGPLQPTLVRLHLGWALVQNQRKVWFLRGCRYAKLAVAHHQFQGFEGWGDMARIFFQ